MNSKKIFKSLFGILLLSVGLFSCTDEQSRADIIPDDDKLVKLSIHTPTSSMLKSTNKSDADECKVSAIKVLVLQQQGQEYLFKYMVDGQQITQDSDNSQITTFTALLTRSEVPLKLLLIANYNDVFDTSGIMVTMNEDEIKDLLTDSYKTDIKGNLPIYGEVELDELITDKVNTLSATMLRSVARVDVYNQIDTTFSEKFKLQNVYVYRANDKFKFIPDADAFVSETSLSVKSPSVPTSASIFGAFDTDVEGEADYVNKIYIPESNAVLDENEQVLNATCLVVGGYYADDDFLSYYRIDFNSGVKGHPFGQVLRNYKYYFNIKQVSHRGWLTPDDAANNESTSIVAVLQVWNEMTSEMFFSDNDNYLGISSRKVTLQYNEGDVETVYLQTTIPFQIQAIAEDGSPTGNIISSPGDKLTVGFYDIEIVKSTDDGQDIYQLIITSTGENKTDDVFTGEFLVTTDFWKFDVSVEQLTYSEAYMNTIVNVLTITSLPGDLGTSDGIFTPNVSGDAMRKVLENKKNFSVTGTVPVKAIIVHSFSNEMLSSSSSAYMSILEKMLDHVEVVHLPKNCSPSEEAGRLIYEWLESEYYRVLILGMDNDSTNVNVRKYYDDINFDGYWRDGTGAITETGTPIYEIEERYLPFFETGPFGPVPMNEEPMGFVEGNMGYNIGYSWDTTIPILFATKGTDNDDKMTHGINMKHGIFYCGESEITSARGNAMSADAAANGTVKSDFDKLMANVWAWIIDRIVTGS